MARVRNGDATYMFMGGLYELTLALPAGTVTGSKSYYAIEGQLLAMSDGSATSYLLTDHLGSVVGVVGETSSLLEERRYLPFGEERILSGTAQTELSFTGQRELTGTGLLDYHARQYDPSLRSFIQPDSIIPNPYGVQGYNRYLYVHANPVRFTDPSGNRLCDGEFSCVEPPEEKNQKILPQDGWDIVPIISDVRSIIRGVETANWASSQPGFMEQQTELQTWYDNCYGQCHYPNFNHQMPGIPVGGPKPDALLTNTFSSGMGEAANGILNIAWDIGFSGLAKTSYGIKSFKNPGPSWHLGLEYGNQMNIIHIGNSPRNGVHIAIGSIKPKFSDFHLYVSPNVYLWRPGWTKPFNI